MQLAAPSVRVGQGSDGTLTYSLSLGPEDLPSIPVRDLEAAWEAARGSRHGHAIVRSFRFDGDAGPLELTLQDAAARQWAACVDGFAGLHTCRGVSLCLRLLALGELVQRLPGRPRLATLLRAAATARLTAHGQLDPASLSGPFDAAGVHA